jgi:hypothetical protein
MPKKIQHLLFASLLVFLPMVFTIAGYIYWFPVVSDDPAQWGQFGDFFGGLWNPVLSFLAFVILVFTLLQSWEAAEHARGAATAAKEQVEIAKSQRDEERKARKVENCLGAIEKEEARLLMKIKAYGAVKDLPALHSSFERIWENLKRIESEEPDHPMLEHFANKLIQEFVMLQRAGRGPRDLLLHDFRRWSKMSGPELASL